MDENGQDKAVSTGAQRVRDYRARRRTAGLIEVKAWVRAQDVERAWTALRPLTDEAGRALARHVRQGQSNQIAVTVRFAHTPPGALRETVLRQGWKLSWDGTQRCWHGTAENADGVEALRQMTAPHGGTVEAGSDPG